MAVMQLFGITVPGQMVDILIENRVALLSSPTANTMVYHSGIDPNLVFGITTTTDYTKQVLAATTPDLHLPPVLVLVKTKKLFMYQMPYYDIKYVLNTDQTVVLNALSRFGKRYYGAAAGRVLLNLPNHKDQFSETLYKSIEKLLGVAKQMQLTFYNDASPQNIAFVDDNTPVLFDTFSFSRD